MISPTLLHLLDEPYWWLLLVCEVLLIGSGMALIKFGIMLPGYALLLIGVFVYALANILIWLSPSIRSALIREGTEVTQWHYTSLMFHGIFSIIACVGIISAYIGMHQ